MNTLKNHVQLIGNLGADPEIKTVGERKKLARFALATHESYRNSAGERVEETQWHQITAWGKLAELCEQFLSKGKEVVISGKLSNSKYQDKEGITRYRTEITANDILFLGKADK